ncbi:hypothetical protein C1H46_020650 [Malus baccata]|uniref:F-box domain-containing protein n=1 Tax=Malus baccata TaxID=106549 RepID=A0A540M4T7_MALBA|nr:hypothetical protein C1H46_020650 [Malus baccata]
MAGFCEMPEAMVLQILSWLPPKSLMRFRCVRKSWYKFINNPSFVDVHLSKSVDNSFQSSTCILFKRYVLNDADNGSKKILLSLIDLCNDNNGDVYYLQDLNLNVPISLGLRHEYLDIAGHCHGIICLTDYSEKVFLCNPALKESKLLPKSCLRLPPPKEINILQSTGIAVGFGYDHKAKDYKVVRIVMHFEGFWILFHPHTAEVYTMSSNSWREIKVDIPSSVVWCPSSQMYFKGVYYWFAIELDKQTLDENKKVILSFDMDDELFSDIPVPESLQDTKECYGSLAVWNGSVALFSFHIESGVRKSIGIWEMNDLEGSWTKQLTIVPIAGFGMPLTFWNSDELVMVAADGRVVSHNFVTKMLKEIPVSGVFLERFQAFVYVYSLVSVK